MESAGKRRKSSHVDPNSIVEDKPEESKTVIIQFRDSEDQDVGFEISVDTNTSKADLNKLLHEIREPADGEEDNQRF